MTGILIKQQGTHKGVWLAWHSVKTIRTREVNVPAEENSDEFITQYLIVITLNSDNQEHVFCCESEEDMEHKFKLLTRDSFTILEIKTYNGE